MSIPSKLRISIALTIAIAALAVVGCSSDETSAPLRTNPLDEVPPLAPANVAVAKEYTTKFLLDWDSNSEPDLAGYRVYLYSPDPERAESYLMVNSQGLLSRSEMILAGESGKTYIFRVTAVDQFGNEGAWSPLFAYTFSPTSQHEEETIRVDEDDPIGSSPGDGRIREEPYVEWHEPIK